MKKLWIKTTKLAVALVISIVRFYRDWRILANGDRYLRVLYEADMWCRSQVKYEDHSLGYYMAIEDVREQLRELCSEYGVSLEDWE
jgi:hypothetical protein